MNIAIIELFSNKIQTASYHIYKFQTDERIYL